ncbi:hypothetical protein QJR26_09045 [Clostridium baratii]
MIFKSDFKKLVIQYNKYFEVKEDVRDYIDLKRKIIKKLKKKNDRELENLKLRLSIETNKKGPSWDNYIATRLADLAIFISVISIIIQNYPELLPNGHVYLIAALFLSSFTLYVFSYKDAKKEEYVVFLLFTLDCVEEVLRERDIKRKNRR